MAIACSYSLTTIDHFTVKVTQYSRGQTFEFYDSQKGDNEMFLIIFLWRSWAIVMKLGRCLPYCPGLRFQLRKINCNGQLIIYSCQSIPCWQEQKKQRIDNIMRSNDWGELKSRTMINVDMGHRNLAGVFEIDAELIIYSWKRTLDDISIYVAKYG